MDAILAFEEEWLPADEAEGGSGIDAFPGTGMDERRLHLRAYERWAAARTGDTCPTLDQLLARCGEEFAVNGLVLQFDEDGHPVLVHVGRNLRQAFASGQAGAPLLARLAAHHRLIVSSQTPVGFEAELGNRGGISTLYRGILMPVADETGAITALYGVINSREVVGNDATIGLALEVDRALHDSPSFSAEALWAGAASLPAENSAHQPFAFA